MRPKLYFSFIKIYRQLCKQSGETLTRLIPLISLTSNNLKYIFVLLLQCVLKSYQLLMFIACNNAMHLYNKHLIEAKTQNNSLTQSKIESINTFHVFYCWNDL